MVTEQGFIVIEEAKSLVVGTRLLSKGKEKYQAQRWSRMALEEPKRLWEKKQAITHGKRNFKKGVAHAAFLKPVPTSIAWS